MGEPATAMAHAPFIQSARLRHVHATLDGLVSHVLRSVQSTMDRSAQVMRLEPVGCLQIMEPHASARSRGKASCARSCALVLRTALALLAMVTVPASSTKLVTTLSVVATEDSSAQSASFHALPEVRLVNSSAQSTRRASCALATAPAWLLVARLHVLVRMDSWVNAASTSVKE